MAIKIRREKNFAYLGVTNFLNEKEKKRADKIYSESRKEFNKLDRKIESKPKISSLDSWYLRGELAQRLILKFKMSELEKKYFWLMLYDITDMNIPDRAKKFHIQNDFHVASILSNYKLNEIEKVGPWGLWREILGSTKIMEDERIAKWIMNYILKKNIKGRSKTRPLLKLIRNRLKNLETKVLSNKELISKLEELIEK